MRIEDFIKPAMLAAAVTIALTWVLAATLIVCAIFDINPLQP